MKRPSAHFGREPQQRQRLVQVLYVNCAKSAAPRKQVHEIRRPRPARVCPADARREDRVRVAAPPAPVRAASAPARADGRPRRRCEDESVKRGKRGKGRSRHRVVLPLSLSSAPAPPPLRLAVRCISARLEHEPEEEREEKRRKTPAPRGPALPAARLPVAKTHTSTQLRDLRGVETSNTTGWHAQGSLREPCTACRVPVALGTARAPSTAGARRGTRSHAASRAPCTFPPPRRPRKDRRSRPPRARGRVHGTARLSIAAPHAKLALPALVREGEGRRPREDLRLERERLRTRGSLAVLALIRHCTPLPPRAFPSPPSPRAAAFPRVVHGSHPPHARGRVCGGECASLRAEASRERTERTLRGVELAACSAAAYAFAPTSSARRGVPPQLRRADSIRRGLADGGGASAAWHNGGFRAPVLISLWRRKRRFRSGNIAADHTQKQKQESKNLRVERAREKGVPRARAGDRRDPNLAPGPIWQAPFAMSILAVALPTATGASKTYLIQLWILFILPLASFLRLSLPELLKRHLLAKRYFRVPAISSAQ
ncbi:hypothetical protein FB451DRAFT_1376519 [Mycena latifolia]|nr:hypothetical protein FB451DRAFT_1376519 [Mycena latifolia]